MQISMPDATKPVVLF